MTRVIEDSQRTVLTIEGKVTSNTSEILLTECQRSLAEGKSIALDLTGISYIDDSGAAALLQIQSDGARLINCSGFVKAILRAQSAE